MTALAERWLGQLNIRLVETSPIYAVCPSPKPRVITLLDNVDTIVASIKASLKNRIVLCIAKEGERRQLAMRLDATTSQTELTHQNFADTWAQMKTAKTNAIAWANDDLDMRGLNTLAPDAAVPKPHSKEILRFKNNI